MNKSAGGSSRPACDGARKRRFSAPTSTTPAGAIWRGAGLSRRIFARTARTRAWPRPARIGAALLLIALAAAIRVLARDALALAPNIPVLIVLVLAAVSLGRAGAVTISVVWILLLAMQLFGSDGGAPLGVADALVLVASLGITIGIGWLIATLAWALDGLEQREAELQASRDRLADVLDALPIGVLVCEAPSGRVLQGNRAVEAILRHPVLPTPDVASYRDWEAYHADGRRLEGAEYPLARVLATGEPAEGEFRYRRGDGSSAWVRITGAPIRDAAGRLAAGVVCVVDIDELRRLTEHQALLMAELSHRVKNALAVVQGMASQTLGRARSLEEFRDAFNGRLQALSTAHALLLRTNWRGTTLAALAEAVLAPYRGERLAMAGGPDAELDARQGVALALVLHELATNAAKYGALAAPGGRLEVDWSREMREGGAWLRLRWAETGLAAPPRMGGEGFGARLIRRLAENELDGAAVPSIGADGVLWALSFPLAPPSDAWSS